MEQYAKENYTVVMLSYRHAFHAGNAADVLKHSALIFCLGYLTQKEKPLLCVDTHAGAGGYNLHEGYAARNREWEQGLGKLCVTMTADGKCSEQLPPLLQQYLAFCFPELVHGMAPEVYPGSPLIMARLLRPVDRLVCCELHPADYAHCLALLTALPQARAEVRQADGFSSLKSLLPPQSRRGLVFIDPSYEIKDDYDHVTNALAMALKRFAAGTYIVWYPLLREPPAAARDFSDRLFRLYGGNRCRVELYTAPGDNSPRGLYGSGLVMYNPPWTLSAALAESLPVLGKLVGIGAKGWRCEFL